ncbi:MAG: hypothetical protein ACI93T_003142, partial [Porticoccaceae bacterium]
MVGKSQITRHPLLRQVTRQAVTRHRLGSTFGRHSVITAVTVNALPDVVRWIFYRWAVRIVARHTIKSISS